MNKIKKVLTVVIMLGVLAAGVYLANNNTETRKGATAAETSSSVLPSEIAGVKVGETFAVTVVVNTGSAASELSTGDFTLSFNKTNLQFVEVEVQSPFELFNDVTKVDKGDGTIFVDYLSATQYRNGAVQVAKVKFKALTNSTSEIKVTTGNITVKGPQTWVTAVNNKSMVTVGEVATTPDPTAIVTAIPTAIVTAIPTAIVTEKYSAIDGFIYGTTFYQSLVNFEGTKGWSRKCPIEGDNVTWSKCAAWMEVDLTNLRGVGGENYKAMAGVVYNNGTTLLQSLIAGNGKDGYYRTCPVDANGVLWNKCGVWNFMDLSNLRGAGGEKYSAQDGFIFNDKFNQSLIDFEGATSWTRTCPMRNGSVSWNECGGWLAVNILNLRGAGGEHYGAMAAFAVNNKVVLQSLIDANGMDSWSRTIPMDANGIKWSNPGAWNYLDLRNLRGTIPPQVLTPVPTAITTVVPIGLQEGSCSTNTDCTADKTCSTEGKCVAPTCAQTAGTCTKLSFTNHTCSVVTDTTKDGAVCNVSSTVAGKCAAGVCKENAVVNECSTNTDCTADKTCSTEGKCVAPTCAQTAGTCTKLSFTNHTCSVVTDATKDGAVCNVSSTVAGKCAIGECKPEVIADGKVKLLFKTAYKGGVSYTCGLKGTLKVVLKKENGDLVTYNNVAVSSSGLSEIIVDPGKNMSLFVKGPQHLQMKYAKDGQTSRFMANTGEIQTVDGKVYDFSKYPMLPGDVNKDGWINGLDFSLMKTSIYKGSEGDFLEGDLDGTCQVNTRDLTLLVNSLDEKQDELY